VLKVRTDSVMLTSSRFFKYYFFLSEAFRCWQTFFMDSKSPFCKFPRQNERSFRKCFRGSQGWSINHVTLRERQYIPLQLWGRGKYALCKCRPNAPKYAWIGEGRSKYSGNFVTYTRWGKSSRPDFSLSSFDKSSKIEDVKIKNAIFWSISFYTLCSRF